MEWLKKDAEDKTATKVPKESYIHIDFRNSDLYIQVFTNPGDEVIHLYTSEITKDPEYARVVELLNSTKVKSIIEVDHKIVSQI